MNKKSVENAKDADLRLAGQALQRAAKRAHELAAKTGTTIVVSNNGIVEFIQPNPDFFSSVQELGEK